LYFALASTIVRELYQRLDEIYGPSNSFHLSKTFPRKKFEKINPHKLVLFLSCLSLVFQLCYIFNELGLGHGNNPIYPLFSRLFEQHWFFRNFPLIFFIEYITVQFFALWFAFTIVFALIDLCRRYYWVLRKSRIFHRDYEVADNWVEGTNKTFYKVTFMSILLCLNAYTYRSLIHNGSTLNSLGFIFFGLLLVLLVIIARTYLRLNKMKYKLIKLRRSKSAHPIRRIIQIIWIIIAAIVEAVPSITISQTTTGSMLILNIYEFIRPWIDNIFQFKQF